MNLSRIIIGPVVTEKAERLKEQKTYVLRVALGANKIDVKNALRRFYDVEIKSIRVLRVVPKRRPIAGGKGFMQKRHPSKRMIVTLSTASKPLDLAAFKA